MEGSGWQVTWEDGRTERVAAFTAAEDAGSMEPYVVSEDGRNLVPASTRGEYTLAHPNQFSRAN